MYAMMGAGAFGYSGVAPPLAARLCKTFASLRRPTLRRILNLPVNTPLTAVYGLLGIKRIIYKN